MGGASSPAINKRRRLTPPRRHSTVQQSSMLKPDIGPKSWFLPHLGVRVGITGMTCYPMVKNFEDIWLLVLIQYTCVTDSKTDGRTDRQTDTARRHRAATFSVCRRPTWCTLCHRIHDWNSIRSVLRSLQSYFICPC